MAHFAQIDKNNIVLQVIVIDNNNALTEQEGQEFIAAIGLEGTWKQTSYNTFGNKHLNGGTPFRKNYAGIGFTYNQELDAFISPKPDDVLCTSYIVDQETGLWVPPVPKPIGTPDGTEKTGWRWDESLLSWVSFNKKS